jgi:hypothetical protein
MAATTTTMMNKTIRKIFICVPVMVKLFALLPLPSREAEVATGLATRRMSGEMEVRDGLVVDVPKPSLIPTFSLEGRRSQSKKVE